MGYRSGEPIFLGVSGVNFASVRRGYVSFPSVTSLDDFMDPINEVQFYVTSPLVEELEFDHVDGDSVNRTHYRLLQMLKDNYSMGEVNLGPVQNLDEKMFDCLQYNLFYAMHANLRDPRNADKVKKDLVQKFVVEDLLV